MIDRRCRITREVLIEKAAETKAQRGPENGDRDWNGNWQTVRASGESGGTPPASPSRESPPSRRRVNAESPSSRLRVTQGDTRADVAGGGSHI